MKIIILGAGQVGTTLAESLVSEDNDITLVDNANALLCGIRDFGQDRSCRVLVLRGAGSHFCGGDEVSGHATDVAASAVTAPLDRHSGDLLYADICEEILLCPKPVLAAVHGVAVGAGAEIACAADQRILDQGARIGTGVITVGNIGGAVLLPRLVGYGRAMEIYLSGRLVGADEALRIGLADHVAPAHLFEQTVTTVAARLAQLPTAAVAHYKQLCLQTATMPITAALHLQNDYHKRIAISVADAHEGQTAFIESRPPRFSGS